MKIGRHNYFKFCNCGRKIFFGECICIKPIPTPIKAKRYWTGRPKKQKIIPTLAVVTFSSIPPIDSPERKTYLQDIASEL
jgi:hypothetical protein